MTSRRDFIRKAALLSGAAGISQFLPASVQRAFAIDPEPGSTYLDAEHIVLLMQENRSFDHTYGTLQGVRGFNDPRAITLPNKNLVWLQANEAGETYAPFRLDINNTKATWMSSLPHSRESQVDARNKGKYDKWLDAKQSGNEEYAKMPLTLGYYTREDIPFYYALADAFTVCDQHFCSSLTGTTPNRLYFWTGTIREEQHESSKANVRNEDLDYGTATWKTFPERLEENGVSWKVYQNEVSIEGGFTGEEDPWLSNFGDNPLEYFSQYNIKLSERYINYLPKKIALLSGEILELENKIKSKSVTGKELEEAEKNLKEKEEMLEITKAEEKKWTKDKYEKLSQHEKDLHHKALATNGKDPFYHQLTPLTYHDENIKREMNIPKGDVLHQFREDVKNGNLPTVSWLVAPENFSDHPSAPWYGAWYLSEAFDILTQNPEVWKKTIFILTYDENDGYFDHVPPFIAPKPGDRSTGFTSDGIDTGVEYVRLKQELQQKQLSESDAREDSVGLGYRVPMVIASPWSRGGWVCSQVFEHTSSLQFLEKFINQKFGKKIEETNLSKWRRTVSGDLTSVFRPYQGEKIKLPSFLQKDSFLESIHKAQFKNVPSDYKKLTKEEIEQVNSNPYSSPDMPRQEKGIRASCALPYQLYADGKLSDDKKQLTIVLESRTEIFGDISAGSPFSIYAPGKYKQENVKLWSYAVAAGDKIKDEWLVNDFENGLYHLCVYGPNGFFREFIGNANDPAVDISCDYNRAPLQDNKLTGNIELKIANIDSTRQYKVEIKDNAYKSDDLVKTLSAGTNATIMIDLIKNYCWYDFTLKIKGNNLFERRYAGRVETGTAGFSDPAMGRMIM